MEYGLYHTHNIPLGAEGFQETRNWKLVDCDRDGDGRFDNDDRSAVPPNGFTLYRDLLPESQDVVVPCSTGNCLKEIVTTLEVNLDDDCDGVPNSDAPELVCFYAEARVPEMGSSQPPYWSGPLQARVISGNGDMTVNFRIDGPTAITLKSLSAKSLASNQTVFKVMISLTILLLMCLVVC